MAKTYFTESYAQEKVVLATPDHYVALGFKLPKQSALAVTANGRYTVKAGTIYPANDTTAIGVVLHDYDVTDGDQEAAVVVHGFVKSLALPTAPVAAAVTAMKQIQFVPYAGTFTYSLVAPDNLALQGVVDTYVSVNVAGGAPFLPAATTVGNWTLGGTAAGLSIADVTLDSNDLTANIHITGTVTTAGTLTLAALAAVSSANTALTAVTLGSAAV